MNHELVNILNKGGVAVMPTDTLYGLVARADKPEAIKRIYEIKGRDPGKKLITLIGDIGQLVNFDVAVTPELKARVEQYWPGPVSLILPGKNRESIAFRLPADEALMAILHQAGPLVAPSANPEGEPPAEAVDEARAYFGERVDYYLDGGRRAGPASQLIDLTGSVDKIIRA